MKVKTKIHINLQILCGVGRLYVKRVTDISSIQHYSSKQVQFPKIAKTRKAKSKSSDIYQKENATLLLILKLLYKFIYFTN